MKNLRHHSAIFLQMLAVALLLGIPLAQRAYGLTQRDLYTEGISWTNLQDDCAQDTTIDGSTGTPNKDDSTYITQQPAGADNEEKIYHFFVDQIHLTPAAAAGIMGNIQAESHFDPADAQSGGAAWNDMSSLDINHGGKGGVGIVQWDGGRRPAYMNYAANHGADKKTLLPQLNYVWYELNHNHTDALNGGTSALTGKYYPGLKNATDPQKAAEAFHYLYEISGDSPSAVQGRMNNATAILAKYQGKAPGTAGGDSAPADNCQSNAGNSSTPQCGGATGTARIICDALKYDSVSYRNDGTPSTGHGDIAEWHSKYCPTIGPSCYTDCSGLVNIAVYDIYHVNLYENTDGERADIGKYWKKISYGDLAPGDIMQPFSDHVEIVDHKQGDVIFTFAAHTSHRAQPLQVGPSKYTKNSGQLYLRYIGPGA